LATAAAEGAARLRVRGVRPVTDHDEHSVLVIAVAPDQLRRDACRAAERVLVSRVDDDPAPRLVGETAAQGPKLVGETLVEVVVVGVRPGDTRRQLRGNGPPDLQLDALTGGIEDRLQIVLVALPSAGDVDGGTQPREMPTRRAVVAQVVGCGLRDRRNDDAPGGAGSQIAEGAG